MVHILKKDNEEKRDLFPQKREHQKVQKEAQRKHDKGLFRKMKCAYTY